MLYLHNAPVLLAKNLEPKLLVVVPGFSDAPERPECSLYDRLDLVIRPYD